jgi:hypothetical protein
MCPKGVVRLARKLAVAALALAAFAFAAEGAELPSQVKKSAAHDSAAAAKKCNIGGVTGVLAPNGVCVRLSGYVSTGFSGGTLK